MLRLDQQICSNYLHFVNRVFRRSYNKVVVELPLGKVQGRKEIGLYGQQFYSFEGIPFAKPPLGDLRFKPPQPVEPWSKSETLDCRKERGIPMQVDATTGGMQGSENCLYLNVYSKHFNSSKPPLPVMVYIYGGSFRTGGATRTKYGPDYLMHEDIVYVLFNYRLCALGFLSLSSPELAVPGNAGLHDQLMALRWVQQHICHFNGDSQNVTLFGESAGAAAVHFMMCLPQAQGLFHKAIIMSGSMLSPWARALQPQMHCCRLALQTGYKGALTEQSMLKHFQELPAERLVQHSMFGAHEHCFGQLHPFVPVQEPYVTQDSLLRCSNITLMRNAWSTQVPLLLGGTSFEGLIMYPYCQMCNGFLMDLLRHQPDMVLPYELYCSMSAEERQGHAESVVKYHYGPRSIDKNNVTQLLDLFSYKLFWHGLHRLVRSRLAYAKAATYLYRFDFDSPTFNLMRIKLCGNDIKRGVSHADDLGYIFHKQGVKELPTDSPEFCTIQNMISIWTAFARTGNPNCPATAPEDWQPLTSKQPYKALNISYQLEFVTQCEKEGLEVWNKLYEKDLY